jgi:hypothetical protein
LQFQLQQFIKDLQNALLIEFVVAFDYRHEVDKLIRSYCLVNTVGCRLTL